jgi:DNA repair protein RadC
MQDHLEIGEQILAARDLADFAASAVMHGEPVDPRSPQMRRYLSRTLGSREVETILAIYVDADGGLLAAEVIAVGSENEAAFPLRPAISRAFDLAARGMLIAHNHPSGLASPSEQDLQATAQLRGLAAALGIELIDHLIVARTAIYSIALGRLL